LGGGGGRYRDMEEIFRVSVGIAEGGLGGGSNPSLRLQTLIFE